MLKKEILFKNYFRLLRFISLGLGLFITYLVVKLDPTNWQPLVYVTTLGSSAAAFLSNDFYKKFYISYAETERINRKHLIAYIKPSLIQIIFSFPFIILLSGISGRSSIIFLVLLLLLEKFFDESQRFNFNAARDIKQGSKIVFIKRTSLLFTCLAAYLLSKTDFNNIKYSTMILISYIFLTTLLILISYNKKFIKLIRKDLQKINLKSNLNYLRFFYLKNKFKDELNDLIKNFKVALLSGLISVGYSAPLLILLNRNLYSGDDYIIIVWAVKICNLITTAYVLIYETERKNRLLKKFSTLSELFCTKTKIIIISSLLIPLIYSASGTLDLSIHVFLISSLICIISIRTLSVYIFWNSNIMERFFIVLPLIICQVFFISIGSSISLIANKYIISLINTVFSFLIISRSLDISKNNKLSKQAYEQKLS